MEKKVYLLSIRKEKSDLLKEYLARFSENQIIEFVNDDDVFKHVDQNPKENVIEVILNLGHDSSPERYIIPRLKYIRDNITTNPRIHVYGFNVPGISIELNAFNTAEIFDDDLDFRTMVVLLLATGDDKII